MPSPDTPASRPSRPPLWLVEGLDIVEQRRSSVVTVAVGVILLGVILAVLAPGVVHPTPLVGAAVAVAAILLGMAAAIAVDASDLRLRGPRHVAAAGGELVAVLRTEASPADAGFLATAVLEAREPDRAVLLGLAPADRDLRPTIAWADALAVALEAQGVRVLSIDLASGRSVPPGLAEVARADVPLASAVTFGPEPRLARLGAGGDTDAALEGLVQMPDRLPRDLDVLLVALPPATSRQAVEAVHVLDHVLLVAQRDRTSRVELIAALDALEAAGVRPQVALLDDRTAARLAPKHPDAPGAPADAAAAVAAQTPHEEEVPEEPAGSETVAGGGSVPSEDGDGASGDASAEPAWSGTVAGDGSVPSEGGDGVPGGPAGSETVAGDGSEPVMRGAAGGGAHDVVGGGASGVSVEPAWSETVAGGGSVPSEGGDVAPVDASAEPAWSETVAGDGSVPSGAAWAALAGSAPGESAAPVESSPRDESAAPEGSEDRDRTDEIPRIGGSAPISDVDPAHDALLNDTARIAGLLDHLELRPDERPDGTS